MNANKLNFVQHIHAITYPSVCTSVLLIKYLYNSKVQHYVERFREFWYEEKFVMDGNQIEFLTNLNVIAILSLHWVEVNYSLQVGTSRDPRQGVARDCQLEDCK